MLSCHDKYYYVVGARQFGVHIVSGAQTFFNRRDDKERGYDVVHKFNFQMLRCVVCSQMNGACYYIVSLQKTINPNIAIKI